MNNEIAVKFEHVDKIYKLNDTKKNKFFDKKINFYALRDVSFEIHKGSVVGVLGSNGSGKSTLSNLLAGISVQDKGSIEIHGEQALIAVQAGLNAQLTGYENIKLKGALLGLKKKYILELIEGVAEFSELGDFLYQPVKKYSSGMKSRLGFSINLCLNPEIIIVDEALSVGDKGFANKCMNKMNELKEEGKTIFFVSHSLGQIRKFCDIGLWIEEGKFKTIGPIKEVADEYEAFVEAQKLLSKEEIKKLRKRIYDSRIKK